MANADLAAQVIENVRGEREAIHRSRRRSSAVTARQCRSFAEVGGVEIDERTADGPIDDSQITSSAQYT
jgi:hypothetical protein